MLFLKQPLILPFLRHKSATTCHIDSKLTPDPCNCVTTDIVQSSASPQQPHKRGTNFWDTLYNKRYSRNLFPIKEKNLPRIYFQEEDILRILHFLIVTDIHFAKRAISYYNLVPTGQQNSAK